MNFKKSYTEMFFYKMYKFFSLVWRKIYIYECKRNGLKISKNCRIMLGVDFGSEPYLIEMGDNVVISKDVLFSTHDVCKYN